MFHFFTKSSCTCNACRRHGNGNVGSAQHKKTENAPGYHSEQVTGSVFLLFLTPSVAGCHQFPTGRITKRNDIGSALMR